MKKKQMNFVNRIQTISSFVLKSSVFRIIKWLILELLFYPKGWET